MRSACLFALALMACLPDAAAFAEEAVPTAAKLAQKAKSPAVTVMEAKKISFVDNVLVTGSLVPREEVLVGPEIDGYRLTELLAEEGDQVKKGQVLAQAVARNSGGAACPELCFDCKNPGRDRSGSQSDHGE